MKNKKGKTKSINKTWDQTMKHQAKKIKLGDKKNEFKANEVITKVKWNKEQLTIRKMKQKGTVGDINAINEVSANKNPNKQIWLKQRWQTNKDKKQ